MATINIPILDLIRLVMASTIELEIEDQDRVLQHLTTNLNEWYNIPTIELSQIMIRLGVPIQSRCLGCNEFMPNFQGDICSDCDTDADSTS